MDNPLVSFVLIAYKQEEYIRDAVLGAFSQTYGPLEIILSDDSSPDRTFEIMEEMAAEYKGPHKLTVRKTSKNLGLSEHINEVFSLAKGEYIIGAAGDDISLPWRTEVLVQNFKSRPECVLLGSYSYSFGEENGITPIIVEPRCKDLKTRFLYISDGIQGCTFAYRKKLIDHFPKLEKQTQIEDIVFAFRAWEIGTFQIAPEVLVLYRRNSGSISSTEQKPETIAYQVKMHCSVIDQISLDLKRSKRSFHEIAPALIQLKNRELYLLKSMCRHKRGSLLDKLLISFENLYIYKFIFLITRPYRLKRKIQRRQNYFKVLNKWELLKNDKEPNRILPQYAKSALNFRSNLL